MIVLSILTCRSKALIVDYIKSVEIRSVFAEGAAEKILDFLRGSLFPVEQNFCFYVRKGIRHFEMYCNTGHEGTNNGIKNAATKVLPNHNTDKCTKIMADHDATKMAFYRLDAAAQWEGKALWSATATVDYLLAPAEDMTQLALEEAGNYASLRTRLVQWFVVRSVDREVKGVMPQYARVYIVTFVDGFLICSCEFFQ